MSFLKEGKNYFLKTPGLWFLGTVETLQGNDILLKDPAIVWCADTWEYFFAGKGDNVIEVLSSENMIVNKNLLLEACEWKYGIPSRNKKYIKRFNKIKEMWGVYDVQELEYLALFASEEEAEEELESLKNTNFIRVNKKATKDNYYLVSTINSFYLGELKSVDSREIILKNPIDIDFIKSEECIFCTGNLIQYRVLGIEEMMFSTECCPWRMKWNHSMPKDNRYILRHKKEETYIWDNLKREKIFSDEDEKIVHEELRTLRAEELKNRIEL